MAYKNLEACLLDLEKNGQLVRIKEEVDPHLEMAAIHLEVYQQGGPALLFENVKGSKFRAASNIFGTLERSKFIFRKTLESVTKLIEIKNDPISAFKNPMDSLKAVWAAQHALPLKNPISAPVLYEKISIDQLPLIQHWPMDGGAFVTLPQVYSEDVDAPGINHANLGMYRIQLSGNDYELNKEIGLHYQLHRGIGVHQTKANKRGLPLKVSVFVGGPPAHTVAAVMPLPEGMSEMQFAGLLGGRRFRYRYEDGFCLSTDADFVITGEVYPGENKPEGPFGDHLGYYSLTHDFPLMKVHQVYAKKKAIWPFTVVGRPPQEDTSFGDLIHEISGDALKHEIPGLKEVHAVDAAGVHPLLLAIGQERYTPYNPTKQPAELLTIANHILGTGQLSLAKFLFITSDETNLLKTRNIRAYFTHFLERFSTERDLHFYTNTTIDTLDYSGDSLNMGSKLVLAAHGDVLRTLNEEISEEITSMPNLKDCTMVMPGIVAIQTSTYQNKTETAAQIAQWNHYWAEKKRNNNLLNQHAPVLLIWCDDAAMVAQNLSNSLWVTFTRSNPAMDIRGLDEFTLNKHWGCSGPVIIDARIKPHHAPVVEVDSATKKSIEKFFKKGGSLYGKL
jgi:4-hydroxy-3-polyprenylbenzoate decarboxylase